MEDLVNDTGARPSGRTLIQDDLDYICNRAADAFKELAGSQLLITGGAGFLGYYLVQSVLWWNSHSDKAPIQLTVYDNFLRGTPDWLVQYDQKPTLTLTEHDVTNPLPSDLGHVDYVVHAASIASPTYYREHPIETMDANVQGLRRLLDYAVREQENGRPLDGFLFFSSSEVYGDPDPEHIPTPETYWGRVSFTGPRACYDESKRYGETLCVNYTRVHSLPIKVARPFNNYGPGLEIADRRVVPDFARDVLNGRDIVMLSDGSPTRTFCYSADAVVGYLKVLVQGRPGEAYNIGADAPEVSIIELAQRTVRAAGTLFEYEGEVVRKTSDDPEYLTDNPSRRCPDITKARTDLDYAPSVSLDEGLRRSLLWYHARQDQDDTLL